MKTGLRAISLIKTSVTNTQVPPGFLFDYRAELLRIVEVIPQGITLLEMADALAVAQKLRDSASGGTIYLKENEHAFLLGKVRAFQFTWIAPELVEFLRAVEEAPELDATALAAVGHPHAQAASAD